MLGTKVRVQTYYGAVSRGRLVKRSEDGLWVAEEGEEVPRFLPWEGEDPIYSLTALEPSVVLKRGQAVARCGEGRQSAAASTRGTAGGDD